MSGFQFKKFSISQDNTALKVGTDSVILGSFAHFDNPQSILDIGTGTGILSLMMAQKYGCRVSAIDIDDGAIIDAKQNVYTSPYKDLICIENVSIQDFSKVSTQKYDGIVCNPPFFSNSLLCADESKTIARHTQTLTPKDLFVAIQNLMNEKGSTYVIIPYSEKVRFNTCATEYGLYDVFELQIFPLKTASIPNRIVIEYAKQWRSFESTSLIIRNEDRSYSDDYKILTKDFYIRL